MTIDWYRNNNNLPKKAHHRLVPSVTKTRGVLTIPNVTSKDVGTYYCEAWANRLAARSHAVNLLLAGKTFECIVNSTFHFNIHMHVFRSTSTTSCDDSPFNIPYY